VPLVPRKLGSEEGLPPGRRRSGAFLFPQKLKRSELFQPKSKYLCVKWTLFPGRVLASIRPLPTFWETIVSHVEHLSSFLHNVFLFLSYGFEGDRMELLKDLPGVRRRVLDAQRSQYGFCTLFVGRDPRVRVHRGRRGRGWACCLFPAPKISVHFFPTTGTYLFPNFL